MKKLIGRIITIVIALLVVGVLTWRLWPQSISSILPADVAVITDFSAVASVTVFQGGESVTHTYSLNDLEQHSNAPQELLDILATSGYRPDMRNLLPKGVDVVYGGKDYDGRRVTLDFLTENEFDTYSGIYFLSSDVVAVNPSNGSGLLIYHPTNPETLNALVEYLQTHGKME